MQRVNNGKSMCILSLGPTSGYITHTLVSDSVATWTVAHQASLSMEFSRQEYWNGFPFSSPEKGPDPGIESKSPELQADSLPSEPPGIPS